MSNTRALNKYSQTAIDSGVDGATPHRLVQLMMEGVLDKVALAKGYMARHDFEAQGRHINWAISLVNGLRMSLNKQDGGEIAENLDSLYDYMVRRLLQAHAEGKADLLDEVTSLMREVKSGWDAVPEALEREAKGRQPETHTGTASASL